MSFRITNILFKAVREALRLKTECGLHTTLYEKPMRPPHIILPFVSAFSVTVV